MTNTATQARISTIMQSVRKNLNQDSVTQVKTYLESQDTTGDLNSLCTALKGNLASANIAVSSAIEQVLQICEVVSLESVVGSTVFYHSDRSHSFYTCTSPDDLSPELLFTTTPDLRSFEAARHLCYEWSSHNDRDLYGSYTNSCSGLLPLDTLALQTCLEAMDHKL